MSRKVGDGVMVTPGCDVNALAGITWIMKMNCSTSTQQMIIDKTKVKRSMLTKHGKQYFCTHHKILCLESIQGATWRTLHPEWQCPPVRTWTTCKKKTKVEVLHIWKIVARRRKAQEAHRSTRVHLDKKGWNPILKTEKRIMICNLENSKMRSWCTPMVTKKVAHISERSSGF